MAFPLYKREMRDERKDYKTEGLRDGECHSITLMLGLKSSQTTFMVSKINMQKAWIMQLSLKAIFTFLLFAGMTVRYHSLNSLSNQSDQSPN